MFAFIGTLILMTACDSRRFDQCPMDQTFGEWGVLKDSYLFGKTDSDAYYIINPIGEVFDSMYYNANYTDSYFNADSTRVTLQYMLNDSAKLYVDRLYVVETNPTELYLITTVLGDTASNAVQEFKFTKSTNSDKLYYRVGNDDLKEVLLTGQPLQILATNFPNTYKENANAQNYSFILYTAGFGEALQKCYEMNRTPYTPPTTGKEEKTGDKKGSKTLPGGPVETRGEKGKINELERKITKEKKEFL